MTEQYHGLDTAERVCFYEQEFYCLSNFSSFTLNWRGIRFDTLEHAYHYEKFNPFGLNFSGTDQDLAVQRGLIQEKIRTARSAHEAYQIAQDYKHLRIEYWDKEDDTGTPYKVDIMRRLLEAKVEQHEYVRRKLLETGERDLVENSWRDSYWGWGPNKDGLDKLGKLWMERRTLLKEQTNA
jgi:ribA/ribD-fused uncharacterized protein